MGCTLDGSGGDAPRGAWLSQRLEAGRPVRRFSGMTRARSKGRRAPGLALGLGGSLPAPPVLELLFVELDVQFLDSRLQALLHLSDSLVVDERADLLEEEAQQRARADVADEPKALMPESATKSGVLAAL